jgi:hypothetical protein
MPTGSEKPKRDINKFGLESTDIFESGGIYLGFDSAPVLPNTTQEKGEQSFDGKIRVQQNKVIENSTPINVCAKTLL